jgi:hypothetical protein
MIDGFSNGQVESKLWLLDALSHVLPRRSAYRAQVLGSWFGLLPRMLTWLHGEQCHSVTGYDIEPTWASHATFLNEPESCQGRARFESQDMTRLDYRELQTSMSPGCLLINTSCEHLGDFAAWYHSLPKGSLVALQGNNFADHDEHPTSWSSFSDFQKATPLETCLYEGELSLPKYQRYMRIGLTP